VVEAQSVAQVATGVRVIVQPVAGKWPLLVVDGKAGSHTYPHLPVLGAGQPIVEAAELFVDRATDDDARSHDPLLGREEARPLHEDSGGRGLERCEVEPAPARVDVHVPAVRRAGVRVLPQVVVERPVEALEYEVVAVQQMYELAARPLQAGIEVAHDADVLGLAVECDAASAEPHDHVLRIVGGRVVVDHLDLHQLRSRVLCEHGAQRPFEIAGAVVRRDHHRPARRSSICDDGHRRAAHREAPPARGRTRRFGRRAPSRPSHAHRRQRRSMRRSPRLRNSSAQPKK
jgi:hypothetical protein